MLIPEFSGIDDVGWIVDNAGWIIDDVDCSICDVDCSIFDVDCSIIDCVDCVNGFSTEDIDTVDCMAIENGCKIGDDTDIVDVIGCDDNVTEGDPMTTKMVSKNLTNQKCGEDVWQA